MSARLVRAWCVLAIVLASVAACGGADEPSLGAGQVSPSKDPTASQIPCPDTARCYDFSADSQGWPDVNDDQHFAGRDPYLDGSYRIVAREPGSWVLAAPLRISDLAQDYGVQVDTDATLGREFSADAAWGAACWTRDLGDGRIAGFAAHVQPGVLTVGLYDENDGTFQPLGTRKSASISAPGKKSHLMLRCRQVSSALGPAARIDAQVDGATSVSVRYLRSVKNYAWSPADGLGLLVAGQGADAFYDNVVVSRSTGH
jgi:hypothetical protein